MRIVTLIAVFTLCQSSAFAVDLAVPCRAKCPGAPIPRGGAAFSDVTDNETGASFVGWLCEDYSTHWTPKGKPHFDCSKQAIRTVSAATVVLFRGPLGAVPDGSTVSIDGHWWRIVNGKPGELATDESGALIPPDKWAPGNEHAATAHRMYLNAAAHRRMLKE